MFSIIGPKWKIDSVTSIIFDKDGTILDSHLYWGEIVKRRANAIINFYGIDSSNFNEVCKFMGYSVDKHKLIPEGPIALVSREEVINVVIEKLKQLSVKAKRENLEEMFTEVSKDFEPMASYYLRILDGVEKLISDAKNKGIKLALITSDSLAVTEKTLNDIKIRHFFDVIFGRESFKENKITGYAARKALEIMNVRAEHSIAIGDSFLDAQMAKNAGLKSAVMVSSGQILKKDLYRYSSFVVESLSELLVN